MRDEFEYRNLSNDQIKNLNHSIDLLAKQDKRVLSSKELYSRPNYTAKTIVVDFDDTLFDTTLIAMRIIKHNYEQFKDYFDYNLLKTPNLYDCYMRNDFYLANSLKKDSITEVPKEIFQLVSEVYNNESVTNYAHPMNIAKALHQYSDESYCSKIYILSECVSQKAAEIKLRKIFNTFGGNPKISFIFNIAGEKTKAQVLNKKKIKFDSFIDDKLANFVDLIKNTDCFGAEFLCPFYGYNRLNNFPEIEELIEKNNNQFFYFNNL